MNDRREQIGTSVAWGLWTLAQVAWLALMAQRVPLSAKWPAAGETWAAMGMATVQLVLACAMGRALLKDVRTALAAIAVAGPMLGLAVVMSGGRPVDAAAGIVCVAAWLGAVASVGSIERAALRAPATGLLLTLTAGGPVMLYLAWEFGRRTVAADGMISHLSPPLGATSILLHGWGRIWVIIAPVCLILGVLVGRLLMRRKKITHASGVRLGGLVG